MPPTIREENKVKCPATETAHPIFSLNPLDMRCNISGRLQPEPGSPCSGDYTRCGIWRTTKDLEMRGLGKSPDLRHRQPDAGR